LAPILRDHEWRVTHLLDAGMAWHGMVMIAARKATHHKLSKRKEINHTKLK
jgi:hypothetical protein